MAGCWMLELGYTPYFRRYFPIDLVKFEVATLAITRTR